MKYLLTILSAIVIVAGLSTTARADGLSNVTITHTEATVATSTTTVLAANGKRKFALIINDGSADVYLRIGESAVLNEGILVTPDGSYEMSRALGNLSAAVVNGIVASGTVNVLVIEGE